MHHIPGSSPEKCALMVNLAIMLARESATAKPWMTQSVSRVSGLLISTRPS